MMEGKYEETQSRNGVRWWLLTMVAVLICWAAIITLIYCALDMTKRVAEHVSEPSTVATAGKR